MTDVQVCGGFVAIATAYKEIGNPAWAVSSRPAMPGKVWTCHLAAVPCFLPAGPVLHSNGLPLGCGPCPQCSSNATPVTDGTLLCLSNIAPARSWPQVHFFVGGSTPTYVSSATVGEPYGMHAPALSSLPEWWEGVERTACRCTMPCRHHTNAPPLRQAVSNLWRVHAAGHLPDQIEWSDDCKTMLVAGEGEPNYYGPTPVTTPPTADAFDPEGSVAIITVGACGLHAACNAGGLGGCSQHPASQCGG